ncbi:Alpha/Beta hydrolase protein [Chytridium lagenaria]|nr:Alpha/Beta hydrolase protein [Chytridium lagenaria]
MKTADTTSSTMATSSEGHLLPIEERFPYPDDAEPVEFVPDWTDWARLRSTLWKSSLAVADSSVFVLVNGAVIAAATWIGIVGFLFIGPILQLVFPRVTRPIRIKSSTYTNTIRPSGGTLPEVRSYLPSSVSASVPTFFEDYEDVILAPGMMDKIAGKLQNPNGDTPGRRPPFERDIARLFIRLSALVYENADVVESIANSWGLNLESMQQDSCAAYVFYSPSHQFIIVVMRGVSPFDLSEILVNAMIQKVRPEGNALPGMIHEGFYNLLSWSSENAETETLIDEETETSRSRNTCDVGELVRMIKEDVLPRIPGEPAIWFTGHSMGAALSTLVLSHLVHVKSALITSSFVKGCYTFGSPKCGDTEFAATTAKSLTAARVVLYRVINADDPVVAFPIGGHTGGLALAMRSAQKEGTPVVCHTDYKHLGVPVVLHCDGVRTVGVDRDLEAIIKNGVFWIVDSISFFGRFVRGREPLMALAHRAFPFPHDHLLVEYDLHVR